MTMVGAGDERADWRRRMRGELFWILLVKLAALTLLWMLFFSAAHHAVIDGQSVSHRLGVAPPPVPSRSPRLSVEEISRG